MLTAVTPFTIKLALEALANLEQRNKLVSAQWRWRIERARYEAELAERRYEEVDPGNRLIASTLEKRWNDVMQRMADLEAELATFERQAMRTVKRRPQIPQSSRPCSKHSPSRAGPARVSMLVRLLAKRVRLARN